MRFARIVTSAGTPRWINIGQIEWFGQHVDYNQQTIARIKLIGNESAYYSDCSFDQFMHVINGTHENEAVKDAYDAYMVLKKLAED